MVAASPGEQGKGAAGAATGGGDNQELRMNQIPFPFAVAGWSGQRPLTRQELREKKKRIEKKARALRMAAKDRADDGR